MSSRKTSSLPIRSTHNTKFHVQTSKPPGSFCPIHPTLPSAYLILALPPPLFLLACLPNLWTRPSTILMAPPPNLVLPPAWSRLTSLSGMKSSHLCPVTSVVLELSRWKELSYSFTCICYLLCPSPPPCTRSLGAPCQLEGLLPGMLDPPFSDPLPSPPSALFCTLLLKGYSCHRRKG